MKYTADIRYYFEAKASFPFPHRAVSLETAKYDNKLPSSGWPADGKWILCQRRCRWHSRQPMRKFLTYKRCNFNPGIILLIVPRASPTFQFSRPEQNVPRGGNFYRFDGTSQIFINWFWFFKMSLIGRTFYTFLVLTRSIEFRRLINLSCKFAYRSCYFTIN